MSSRGLNSMFVIFQGNFSFIDYAVGKVVNPVTGVHVIFIMRKFFKDGDMGMAEEDDITILQLRPGVVFKQSSGIRTAALLP